MIKTRFAPSPTGNLHVGSVRTALFSYLYAKAHQGQFILRIEDTDSERSTRAHADAIIEAMQWLGLTSDEPVVFQSERQARYAAVCEQLLATGLAYRCTCDKARLESMRATQTSNKQKPRYDGHCRNLSIDAAVDAPFVVRLKSPTTGAVSFDDLVYGTITVSNTELDDLILMRSDGVPTYNFAVVVDDADMQITQVIRGDDHINNTPRQIHVYQALNWPIPRFAHLPMILGNDGKRLSKRHGAVNVLEFQTAGYLPAALLNYLVRLGWSHQDQEIFSQAEMVHYFNLAHVSKSPACFDYDKLNWLNQHYLKTLPSESLVSILAEQLAATGIYNEADKPLAPIIQVLSQRVVTLHELAIKSRCFLMRDLAGSQDTEAMETHLTPAIKPALQQLYEAFKVLPTWDKDAIHLAIKQVCDAHALGMGKVAQPLRVAVTGGTQSPSIDETLVLIGRSWALERLAAVL